MRYNSKMEDVSRRDGTLLPDNGGVGELRDLTCRSMYCAFPFPSPIYNSKTGGVSYDFFVVGTIDDGETVEKRRKRGGCGPFKISVTPSTHIQLRRKRGVGVLPHRVLLVRGDRTHSH
jgi:hypothetical protein